MKKYLIGQIVKVLWSCEIESTSRKQALLDIEELGTDAEWVEEELVQSSHPFILKGNKYANYIFKKVKQNV